jgi:hypothetical protein
MRKECIAVRDLLANNLFVVADFSKIAQLRCNVYFRFEVKTEPDDTGEKKLSGLSQRANYTDRAIAAFLRSQCQLLRI